MQRNSEVQLDVASIPVYRVQLVQEPWEVVAARPRIDEPKDAAEILRPHLEHADREHIVILMLDAMDVVIGIHTVSIGVLSEAITSCREIFKAALLANAASIIISHNHPSGITVPSDPDMAITKSAMDAGHLLGVEVVDHIIIGSHGRYYSMKECNLLPTQRRRIGRSQRPKLKTVSGDTRQDDAPP